MRARNARSRFEEFGNEQWYDCSEPADDPMITCFLAPEWMGLGSDRWVCSDALKSDDKRAGSDYSDDSY